MNTIYMVAHNLGLSTFSDSQYGCCLRNINPTVSISGSQYCHEQRQDPQRVAVPQ